MKINELMKKLTLVSKGEETWTPEDNDCLLEYIFALDNIRGKAKDLSFTIDKVIDLSIKLEDAVDDTERLEEQ
jgi:hypothetical protein